MYAPYTYHATQNCTDGEILEHFAAAFSRHYGKPPEDMNEHLFYSETGHPQEFVQSLSIMFSTACDRIEKGTRLRMKHGFILMLCRSEPGIQHISPSPKVSHAGRVY